MHLYYEQDREDLPMNADPFCPLCNNKKEKDSLDYHHWDYESGAGVQLCRECHEKIHDGVRASEQTEQQPEGETWHRKAVENLLNIHTDRFGPPASLKDFFRIYNLPNKPVFVRFCRREI